MKMQIKYHKPAEYGELGVDELNALRYWHKICIAFAIVIGIAGIISLDSNNIDIRSAHVDGFAHWFLVCCAYPVLSFLGLINMIFSTNDTFFMRFITHEQQVLSVFLIDIISIICIWLLGRWVGIKTLGAEKLRVVANFIAILTGWGILQLSLLGLIEIWNEGGIEEINNRKLHKIHEIHTNATKAVNEDKTTPLD